MRYPFHMASAFRVLLIALACLATGVARAADPELAALQQLVAELIPEVEAAAGRSFREVPEVVLAEPADIARVLRDEQVHLMARISGLDPDAAERTVERSTNDQVASFVGKYGFLDKKLYVLRGGVRIALAARGVAPELVPQVTELVLAHELVHALQDQYVDLAVVVGARPDGDAVVAVNCTVEGHAVWVQERVGRARGHDQAVREVAKILGYDPDGGGWVDPESFYTSYVYGQGRNFVAHHAEVGGIEATWALLANPPARSAMILAPAEHADHAEPPFDARVRGAVTHARARLAPGRWRAEDEAVGDYSLRERLAPLPFGHLIPQDWAAGWSSRASSDPLEWVEVQLLAFDHAEAADAYVAGMALQAEVDLAMAVPPVVGAMSGGPRVDGSVAPFGPMADEAAEQRLTVALGPGEQAQELRQVWASRGNYVVQVSIVNHRAADARVAQVIRRVFRAAGRP